MLWRIGGKVQKEMFAARFGEIELRPIEHGCFRRKAALRTRDAQRPTPEFTVEALCKVMNDVAFGHGDKSIACAAKKAQG
ncbi:hypothetical protein Cst04h_07660 [Corynebacterium striatum]|uniref:Uncharacterized protein n=1 Tax=Corynebacterium striatum TaxID=43770 RepID=A0ABC9ZKS9_CORST|nr:hypothetical protein Cst04h_07660 [Corynebacterium striatum]GKH18134.1 hypothetical protein CE91St29_24470 [Corynebacterium striatum]